MSKKIERVLYFDLASGASGDMILGALLDLFDKKSFQKALLELETELDKLNLGLKLIAKKKMAGAINATDVEIKVINNGKLLDAERIDDHHSHKHGNKSLHHHRGYDDIQKIVKNSSLHESVKDKTMRVFKRLGEAEAKIHGKTLDDIHFHEVGALDTIADIVGSIVLTRLLKVDRIVSSPVNLGTGELTCAHGKMNVPAPAPLEILKNAKVPCYIRETDAEVFTPTAAAILTEITDLFSYMPEIEIDSIGYGRGKNEIRGKSNSLRVVLGIRNTKSSSKDNVEYDSKSYMIEVNIDDMNPEHYELLSEHLFEAGAKDVCIIPILMKKNRPGSKLSVVCNESDLQVLIDIIFKHSTTTGVRFYQVMRQVMEERFETVLVEGEKVRVKCSYRNDKLMNRAPEYEDCKKVAKKTGLPLKEVYRLALKDF